MFSKSKHNNVERLSQYEVSTSLSDKEAYLTRIYLIDRLFDAQRDRIRRARTPLRSWRPRTSTDTDRAARAVVDAIRHRLHDRRAVVATSVISQ